MQLEGRKFGVSRWAAWPPSGSGEDKPDIQFVPPLLRRRLSRLSGIALAVANQCLGEMRAVPIVFASRHGELGRTANILADLARAELPSPTAFSLSVHNSTTGLLALVRGDRTASTAIAAGPLTLAMGLLEALVQAIDVNDSALLICAEGPTPALYSKLLPDESPEFALAILVTVKRQDFSLERVISADTTQHPARLAMQAAALATMFAGAKKTVLLGDAEQTWRIRRNACSA